MHFTDENEVGRHIIAIQEAFRKKGIEYDFILTTPIGHQHGICRRYTLPLRFRDSERARLDFLQVFNANRPYNIALPGYRFKMSVVSTHEPKKFSANPGSYPNIAIEGLPSTVNPAQAQVTTPAQATMFSPSTLHSLIGEVDDYRLGRESPAIPSSPSAQSFLGPVTPTDALASPSPTLRPKRARLDKDTSTTSRAKLVHKPNRDVQKNSDGLYECDVADCTESVRTFSRKCEYK